ncbi:Phenylalanine--tRNA ligase alpha subunit A [Nymphon striatum]|nr:Phenylalanine--tRNA ligase alpha subunit A [Nymphon striatum]
MRAKESITEQMKKEEMVASVKTKKKKKKAADRGQKYPNKHRKGSCSYCGGQCKPRQCPAYGKKCNNWQKAPTIDVQKPYLSINIEPTSKENLPANNNLLDSSNDQDNIPVPVTDNTEKNSAEEYQNTPQNMCDINELILKYIEEKGAVNSLNLASYLGIDHQKVVGAIKSLQSLGEVIDAEQCNSKQVELTEEGKQIVQNGSHEALLYKAVPQDGILQADLLKNVPNSKLGFGKAMSNGWITVDKKCAGGARVFKKVDQIEDQVQLCLQKIADLKISEISDNQKNDFKKRKLLQENTLKSYNLKKGSAFSLSVSKPETDLTPEMIATSSWKEKSFKAYNFDALGVPPDCGHLHPLMKVRAEFRQIFLEMGFTEMPTNRYVESAFWNFDVLFQPQQHPARDAHDTFFVSDPKDAKINDSEYIERVKRVHSKGGYGSQGYQCDWKIEEAQKNILRTHTTSVSARMLYQLAQQASETFKPSKFFSIDRVFRNETLDATHLAEFHQIEGLVADYNLTLGHLIGILHEFFNKLGITKLRFKPAYNPYTEPSMEIFSYHEGLQKWVELGNSGIFRPEMLLPMGLPPNVTVIAWGLSTERPTMIKYGLNNIRDLCGHKVDLHMVQKNPICRLDK